MHGSTPATAEYFGEDADWHLGINDSLLSSRRGEYRLQWQIHAYRQLITPGDDGSKFFVPTSVQVIWISDSSLPVTGGQGDNNLNIWSLGRQGSFANLGKSENYKLGSVRQPGDPDAQRTYPDTSREERTVYTHEWITSQQTSGSVGPNIPDAFKVNGRLIARLRFQVVGATNIFVEKNVYYYDEASIRAAKGR